MSDEFHDLEHDIRGRIGEYLEMQIEVIEHLTGTESVAQQVLDAVAEAVVAVRSPVGPSISVAVRRFRALGKEYIEPALEVFTAQAFAALLPDLVQFEERLESLVQAATDAQPSERAGIALSKLSRCYLLGFDAETIAMCRTTLEAAINDSLGMQREPASRTLTEGPMKKKLAYLRSAGRLSEADHDAALEVWDRGNEVLHNDPTAVADAPGVVNKTVSLVVALFS